MDEEWHGPTAHPLSLLRMLIGILSDTHDDMSSIRRAVDTFNSRGVSHVIHAGDLVSPFTFELFSTLQCNMTAIFGNNDGDKVLLQQKSKGNIYPQPFLMTFNEKRIVVVHEPDLVGALADSGHFDLIIYGHTHTPDIRKTQCNADSEPGQDCAARQGETYHCVARERDDGGGDYLSLARFMGSVHHQSPVRAERQWGRLPVDFASGECLYY